MGEVRCTRVEHDYLDLIACGTVPTDEELSNALHQYAREQLPLERRLDRLRVELGYIIK